jgi:hypothetical protein
MMKVNKWTLGLAAVGLVSLPVVQAEEKPNQLLTALSSTTISGYVDTSAQWTLGSGNANPPAYSYNTPAKQDGFNVNVVDITLEKPLDEGTWSAGYKVELWFGPNSSVLGNNVATGVGGDDVALKQGYVALRAPVGNGVDIKIGTFDTIVGYEVANSGSNPNYTRSYGYSIEPTQQTGVLASYQLTKLVGVVAGIANLWSPGLGGGVPRSPRAESDKTYMGAVTLTAPEDWGFLSGSTLSGGIVDGYSTGLYGIANDLTSFYVGTVLNTPWKKVKVGASYDYVTAHDNGLSASGHAQALALYTSLQATEKMSLHARAEYFEMSDAFASGGSFNSGVPGTSGVGVVGGIPAEAVALTGTLQYDLWNNVLSRLEVRWDHATKGSGPFGGTVTPSRKDEVMVAANVIYKF